MQRVVPFVPVIRSRTQVNRPLRDLLIGLTSHIEADESDNRTKYQAGNLTGPEIRITAKTDTVGENGRDKDQDAEAYQRIANGFDMHCGYLLRRRSAATCYFYATWAGILARG